MFAMQDLAMGVKKRPRKDGEDDKVQKTVEKGDPKKPRRSNVGSRAGKKTTKGRGRGKGRVAVKGLKKDNLPTKCSVNVVRTLLKRLEGRMTVDQKRAIENTPFHHLVTTSMNNCSRNRVLALVECYNPENKSFEFGNGISLSFHAWEFSVVLGLHYTGVFVHPHIKRGSNIVGR